MALIRSSIQYEYANAGAATISAGTGIQIGTAAFGVAEVDIPVGATGVLAGGGIWSLPCGNTLTASAGDLAYWDKTNGVVVTSGASLLCIGVFTTAVTSGTTAVDIAVFPTGVVTAAG